MGEFAEDCLAGDDT